MSNPPPYNPNYPPPPQNYGGAYPPPPPPNAGYNFPGGPPPVGQGYGMPPPPPMHGGYGTSPHVGGGMDSDVEWGQGQPKSANFAFDNKTIRQGFIRKVFLILTVQLSFVAGLVALFVFQKDCKLFVQRNSWVYFLSYGAFLGSYIALICCESVRRRFPGNMICLSVLTASMGYMVAMISSFYDQNTVFIALAITTLCCAAIVVFAMQTKYDFTGCISIMVVLGFVLLFFGIAAIIVATLTTVKIVYVVYCGLGAAFFMVWLAIDVQLLMGGKRVEISPEDYVYAATQLFLDIVYIFIYILQIVGYSRGN